MPMLFACMSPRAYVLSLRGSIARYRADHAQQSYLDYLYGLYYEALDDLWEEQEREKQREKRVMRIWIVQAEHAFVPGQPMTAHATKASANREAASLVNIMLKDCGLAQFAAATCWKRGLQECNKTRDDPDRRDYDVWFTELEVTK